MKLKKICIGVIVGLLLVGNGAINAANAMEVQKQTLPFAENQQVTPLWNDISDIFVYLSAEGSNLYPETYIEAKETSGKIAGTMYLEKYSSGKWVSVTSWNISGTGEIFLSKSYKGTSGFKYRTRVVVNVNGENAIATSSSCEI